MQNVLITTEGSKAISCIRGLAMLSIVVCHLLQTYDNDWAWVFNVGVQVFLVLSGFLYGHKEIHDWKGWFVKRLFKIYIPYLLFLFAYLFLFLVFRKGTLSVMQAFSYIVDIQGFKILGGGKIPGLGHTWFLTAIAVCYAVTPLLQKLRRHADVVLPVIIMSAVVEYCYVRFHLFYFSWIFLYAVGYYYPVAGRKLRLCVLLLFGLSFAYALSGIDGQIVRDTGDVLNRVLHECFGFLSVLAGVPLLGACLAGKHIGIMRLLDEYSYEIYLVHVFAMRSPFSLLDDHYASIFLVVASTVLGAYVLKRSSAFASERLKKMFA